MHNPVPSPTLTLTLTLTLTNFEAIERKYGQLNAGEVVFGLPKTHIEVIDNREITIKSSLTHH